MKFDAWILFADTLIYFQAVCKFWQSTHAHLLSTTDSREFRRCVDSFFLYWLRMPTPSRGRVRDWYETYYSNNNQ